MTRAGKLTVLFTIMYMVSYITRINFGAVISEMVVQTGLSKAALGMSLTGSFVFYGAGQIVSGVCGDRISPKKLISWGFAATVLMNLLIPLCRSHYAMLAVWCVNGFA
ncbi:MAG: MFS transporter, partial [Clostridia bacterium]|nr:MFS transporter [Clostridia bacterium]